MGLRNPLLRYFPYKKVCILNDYSYFAASVLAKPLNNAQIVRGVFVFMGIWQQGFRL